MYYLPLTKGKIGRDYRHRAVLLHRFTGDLAVADEVFKERALSVEMASLLIWPWGMETDEVFYPQRSVGGSDCGRREACPKAEVSLKANKQIGPDGECKALSLPLLVMRARIFIVPHSFFSEIRVPREFPPLFWALS